MPVPPVLRLFALGALTLVAACPGDSTEPDVPGSLTAVSQTAFSSVAGAAVGAGSLPSVKVTTSSGKALPNIQVSFAIASGGGTGGGTATTNSEGIATAASWTIATTAGSASSMTATVPGQNLTGVTFTATGTAGPAAKLVLTTSPAATAVNRAVLPTAPIVQLQDANSNAVSSANVSITASITAGGGTLGGVTSVSTTASGTATFTSLSISGTIGQRTLTFSSPGLTSATANVTTTTGPAAALAKEAGDNQAAFPNTNVPIPPAVKVTDADGNVVSGTQVTFSVTSGGGSVAGGIPVSGTNGVATVTSWTLGAALGTNTLSANVAGLGLSPLVFTATSTNTLVDVTAVSPATLTSGATATISGSGFSATPANNTVTIDGVTATVTAASASSLTVTVPDLPCTTAHSGAVSVTVGGVTGSRNHPVQAATTHTLSVGQSAILSTASAARCNELANTNATAVFYLSVYNTNTTYSTTGAAFELKGSAGAATAVVPDMTQTPRNTNRVPRPRPLTREQEMERNHLNFLERDLEFLKQNGWRWNRQPRSANLVAAIGTANAVGDAVTLRMRDISKTTCNDFVDITGRVAFIGTKAIIIEDSSNPIAGTIDTTYAQIGNEFDQVMWPILENNYGNALINDANLDANGKFIMVFTDKVRSLSNGGIAGFVTSCDLFHRTNAGFPNAASNFGEYFYATSPTMAGDISCTGITGTCNSPPRWRWSMRGTIIHEVKHIVSIAERLAKNPANPSFEVSWLEETTARISEELYERARYGLAQKTNIGYGSTGNQVGPWCGVRLGCNQARGIVRVFEELGARWYQAPQNYSPIGRIDASDFSFYATGWSLVRWALDRSATAEATILKNMTQHATLTGIANFDAHVGTTYAEALPRWTLSMVVDDYPGITVADAALRFPSWDLRNVFTGYKTDFPNASFAAWPLVANTANFGSFSSVGSVRAGTAAIFQLSGPQAAKQLLELKASGSSAAAPAELRMSIVRVQ
jgi:hypothetical protein